MLIGIIGAGNIGRALASTSGLKLQATSRSVARWASNASMRIDGIPPARIRRR